MSLSNIKRFASSGMARQQDQQVPIELSKGSKTGLTANGKIDLCRGLLAWLVVLCHAFAIAHEVHPTAKSLTAAQFAFLDHTVNAGFVWVMGFFVISGYCIHQAVARRLTAEAFPLRRYLTARLTRILPLYYPALAFVVIAEPLIAATRLGTPYGQFDYSGFLAQLFLVQNMTHQFGSFSPSWSLTNEVFYYLIYGVLAATAGRYRARPFFIGMGLCVFVGGFLQLAYLSGYRSPLILRTGMLFGLGINWFLGVGIAVFREEIRRSRWIQALSKSWPLVLASAFAGYHRGLTIQFAYIVSGIAFTLLLIRIVASPKSESGIVEPAWATRLVHFAGLSSYPTYLFHFALMWLIATAVIKWNLVGNWLTLMGLLVASSLALGALLGWYVERPIMRWRTGYLARLETVESSGAITRNTRCGFVGSGKEFR